MSNQGVVPIPPSPVPVGPGPGSTVAPDPIPAAQTPQPAEQHQPSVGGRVRQKFVKGIAPGDIVRE